MRAALRNLCPRRRRSRAERRSQPSSLGGGRTPIAAVTASATGIVVTRVLFVCVANSGRSVMAERLFRQAAGSRHDARSAGSQPGRQPHPVVLDALREIGLDASDHVPRLLDEEVVQWAEIVVATCDDACPVVPGKRYISWPLPDPKDHPIEEVRPLRDEIASRVDDLVRDLDRSEIPAHAEGSGRR